MNLLPTIAACLAASSTSSAFTPTRLVCGKHHSTLLFASTEKDIDVTCGPGFKRVEGTDGPCCAYDFDAVSSKVTPAVLNENPELSLKLEEKNKTRKKFGLPPLNPEEFVVLQAQIHAMESEQDEIQSVAKQAIVAEREEMQRQQQLKSESSGLLQSFISGIFEDTCQSNFDCNRPEVCCDFRFKKVCCSSGDTRRNIENELATIPVPQGR
mmetsp:Transcript_41371/g.86844  ORF Transcript_41371/g.86844 Transcript_41371/m.86844 type:complete len:211 (-) Transcript_41371:244-876(-)